jgi:putative endonuclease
VTRASLSRRVRSLLLARAPRWFVRWCTLDDRELGEWGEELAARYLRARGCRILGRRLETAFAEIDIVALERGSIVCVEVKTGRLEPLPRPRRASASSDLTHGRSATSVRGANRACARSASRLRDEERLASVAESFAVGELRWRPGHRCDAARIARLRRAARWLQERWADPAPSSPRGTDARARRPSLPVRAPRGVSSSRAVSGSRPARVDLIEVILPMSTRRPRLVHHADIRRPIV